LSDKVGRRFTHRACHGAAHAFDRTPLVSPQLLLTIVRANMSVFSSRAYVAAVGLVGLGLVGPVAACGDDDGAGRDESATPAEGSDLDGSITVFAAASLTDAFDEVGAAFEDANPGVSVQLDYGGSSSLRDQILAGAPGDVFASANDSTMDAVAGGDGLAGDPEAFVANELEIVVPAGNEAGVEGLDDLGDESLLIGLCDEQVPCGELGREALANAGVAPAPDTNELDVRSLLDKVASGELDAGLVYATDVRAAGGRVEPVEIPDEDNVVTEYPIATLSTSENIDAAEAFVAFVLSDDGQRILASYGFGRPA
jgi:molybdate transport system substrate-binding protein